MMMNASRKAGGMKKKEVDVRGRSRGRAETANQRLDEQETPRELQNSPEIAQQQRTDRLSRSRTSRPPSAPVGRPQQST